MVMRSASRATSSLRSVAACSVSRCALVDRLKAMTAENWTTIRDELVIEIGGQAESKDSDVLLLK